MGVTASGGKTPTAATKSPTPTVAPLKNEVDNKRVQKIAPELNFQFNFGSDEEGSNLATIFGKYHDCEPNAERRRYLELMVHALAKMYSIKIALRQNPGPLPVLSNGTIYSPSSFSDTHGHPKVLLATLVQGLHSCCEKDAAEMNLPEAVPLLHALSILVYWSHNRRLISQSMGKQRQFAVFFVHLLRKLASLLTPALDALVLTCLSHSLQIIVLTMANMQFNQRRQSTPTFLNIGEGIDKMFMPPLPWNDFVLQRLGFHFFEGEVSEDAESVARLLSRVEDATGGGSSCAGAAPAPTDAECPSMSPSLSTAHLPDRRKEDDHVLSEEELTSQNAIAESQTFAPPAANKHVAAATAHSPAPAPAPSIDTSSEDDAWNSIVQYSTSWYVGAIITEESNDIDNGESVCILADDLCESNVIGGLVAVLDRISTSIANAESNSTTPSNSPSDGKRLGMVSSALMLQIQALVASLDCLGRSSAVMQGLLNTGPANNCSVSVLHDLVESTERIHSMFAVAEQAVEGPNLALTPGPRADTVTLSSLLLRRGLLVIQINSKLMQAGVANQSRTNVVDSARMDVALVGNFMMWLAKTFCTLSVDDGSSAGPLHAQLRRVRDSLQNMKIECVFPRDFPKDLISPALEAIDLWPWKIFPLPDAVADRYAKRGGGATDGHDGDGAGNMRGADYHLCAQSSGSTRSRFLTVFEAMPGAAAWSAFFGVVTHFLFPKALVESKAKAYLESAMKYWVACTRAFLEARSTHKSSTSNTLKSSVPIFQAYSIRILHAYFRIAPDDALDAMRKSRIWELIRGGDFLRGGAKQLAQVCNAASFTFQGKPKRSYKIMVKTWVAKSGGNSDAIYRCLQAYAWMYLRDSIFDLALECTRNEISYQSSRSGHEILNIIEVMKPQAQTTIDALMLSYQASRWLRMLLTGRHAAITRQKCLMNCLDLIGSHLEIIGLIRQESQTAQINHFSKDEEEFLWPARATVVELTMFLSSTNLFPDNVDWVKLFVDQGMARSDQGIPQPNQSSNADGCEIGLSGDALRSTKVSGKRRIKTLASLLLDPRCRGASLKLLIRIVNVCGVEWSLAPDSSSLPKTDDGSLVLTRSNYHSMAAYVIESIIYTIRLTLTYPQCEDNYHCALLCLQSLTWMLRAADYSPLRTTFQDFFRVNDSVSALLVSLIGFEEHSTEIKEAMKKSPDKREIFGKIARQGVALLTAIMSHNDTIKAQFLANFSIGRDAQPHNETSHSDASNPRVAALLQAIAEDPSNKGVGPDTLTASPGAGKASHVLSGEELVSQHVIMDSQFGSKAKGFRSPHSAPSSAPLSTASTTNSVTSQLSTPVKKSEMTFPESAQKKKQKQQRVISHGDLTRFLLDAESPLSMETALVLFDLIFDGPCLNNRAVLNNPRSLTEGLFHNDDDRPKIHNQGCVPFLFDVLPHCEYKVQHFILATLMNLVNGRASLVNLTACTQSNPSVIDLALDLFPKISDERIQVDVVMLLQRLGSHSISIAQMKHMFKIMQSNNEYRPSYNWRIVSALQGMITEECGPRHSFVFEGLRSGLLLPPINCWPDKKPFSFCTWLLVESPQSAQSELAAYRPSVLSLRTQSGGGLEVYLSPDGNRFRAVIETYTDLGILSSSVSPDSKEMMLSENGWHFLALSLSKSNVVIALDGQTENHPSHFPFLFEAIADPMLGDQAPAFRKSERNSTLRGQMGAIYFFSESLSESKLRSIFELGPSYFYSFESFTTEYRGVQDKKQKASKSAEKAPTVLDGSLTKAILLAYNPAVWKDDFFFDNTPTKNNVVWKMGKLLDKIVERHFLFDSDTKTVKMHALKMPGTYRSTSQDVRMALDSLGGVKCILPIFAQLDMPRPVPGNTAIMDTSPDINLSGAVLNLLVVLLDNIGDHQSRRISGLALLSYFLDEIDRQHLTSHNLECLSRIFECVHWNTALQDNMLENIFLNFKLWRDTAVNVQLQLFARLEEFISDNHARFRDIMGVRRLLDCMFLHYERESVEKRKGKGSPKVVRTDSRDDRTDSNLSGHSTSAIDDSMSSSFLTIEDFEILRTKFFSIIEMLLKTASPFIIDDIDAIVTYISVVQSAESKIEGFQLLFEVLNDKNLRSLQPLVVLAFSRGKCLHSLSNLCSFPDSTVRLSALIIFCKILSLSIEFKELPEPPRAYRQFDDKKMSFRDSDSLRRPSLSGAVQGNFSSVDTDKSSLSTATDSSSDSRSGDKKSGGNTSWSSLEELGLGTSTLSSTILSIQSQLLHYLHEEAAKGNDVKEECEIILGILQNVMFGETFDHIIESVEAAVVTAAAWQEKSKSQAHTKQKKNSHYVIFRTDMKICVPMLFNPVLNFIADDVVPEYLRLSTLVNLKASVSVDSMCSEIDNNCDLILRQSGWQHYVMSFLVKENSRIVSNKGDNTVPSDDVIYRCRDICLEILFNLHAACVRIGAPLGPPLIVDKIQTVKSITDIDVLQEMSRGERHLGLSVLRETLSYMQKLNDGKSTTHGFLLRIASLLATRVLNAIQAQTAKVTHSAEIIATFKEKSLHFNMWFVALIGYEIIKESQDAGTTSGGLIDDETVGLMLDSLANFLLPLNVSVPVWMAEERTFRIHLASPSAVAIESPNVVAASNSLAESSALAYSVGNPKVLSKIKVHPKKILLSHVNGGICWMMSRFICAVLEKGCRGSELKFKAISHLRFILNLIRSKDADVDASENLFAIACLSEAVSSAELEPENDFGRVALELLLELLERNKNEVHALLWPSDDTGITFGVDADQTHESLATSASAMMPQADATGRDIVPPLTNYFTSQVFPEVDSVLKLLDEKKKLTPRMWASLMCKLKIEGENNRMSPIKVRLAEMDLCTESDDPLAQISRFKFAEILNPAEWKAEAKKIGIAVETGHANRIINEKQYCEDLKIRNEAKVNAIIREVASERGPWGYGIGDQREVFWVLDNKEVDSRKRLIFRRNPKGVRHNKASAVGNMGEIGVVTAPDSMAVDAEDKKLQDIWKALNKSTKSAKFAVLDGSEEDSDEDDDDRSRGDDDDDDKALRDPHLSASADEAIFAEDVQIITPASSLGGDNCTKGRLEVTFTKISFTRSSNADHLQITTKHLNDEFLWVAQTFPSTSWSLNDLQSMYARHYILQFTAVELFFTSRLGVFINFFNLSNAKRFYQLLANTRIRPERLYTMPRRRPEKAILKLLMSGSQATITEAWVDREISNFEYLMLLNTVSGRTFNDLSQYPIFPWILADYQSKNLNLKDPNTFRDLRYPIGAQTESQRVVANEKYDITNELHHEMEGQPPPYHHGSHYSCKGHVFGFLIRTEPFTSLHVWFQSGRFDHADRLFHSMADKWRSVTSNPNDVKELLPEFFCSPEFLENMNKIDLGTTQGGQKLSNVELPPWCKDAHDFVRIHRQALESDFVSMNLHHWIDLIFGYKQRPPGHLDGHEHAIEFCNVYHPFTYQGGVDLESLNDATIRQIEEFGQMPCRLFNQPHPRRTPFAQAKIIWPIASVVHGADTTVDPLPEMPNKILCFPEEKVSSFPVLLIAVSLGHMVTVDSCRVLGYHVFQAKSPDVVPPYTLTPDIDSVKLATGEAIVTKKTLLSSMGWEGGRVVAPKREFNVGVPFSSMGLAQRASLSASQSFDADLVGKKQNKQTMLRQENERRRIHQKRSEGARPRTGTFSARGRGSLSSISSSASLPLSTLSMSSSSMTASMSSTPPDALRLRGDQTKRSRDKRRSMRGRDSNLISAPLPSRTKKKSKQDRVDENLFPHLFAVIPETKLLFSCGHWDDSFKVTRVDTGALVQSISIHSDVVTCLCIASDYGHNWLVTGSNDCTVMVWEVVPERIGNPVTGQPLHVLYGHDDSVTCVAVNAELDIIVSGSEDGTIIVYSLREGSYIRSLVLESLLDMHQMSNPMPMALEGSRSEKEGKLLASLSVQMICVSKESFIVAYCSDGHQHLLCTFTVNGKILESIDTQERLHCMCLSEDGLVLLTGGERCLVVFRWVTSLLVADDGPRVQFEAVLDGDAGDKQTEGAKDDAVVHQGPFLSPIRSLYLTRMEGHLIVGLESGHIRILAQDSDYLRKRLVVNLENIGLIS